MPLQLAEKDRPYMDARRMTNVGLVLKGEKNKVGKRQTAKRPKPLEAQSLDTPMSRLAWNLHNARRQRYLEDINRAVYKYGPSTAAF